MQIIPLHTEDLIQLKKPHPCGGDVFRVLRVGSEVRIVCRGCGRDMTLDRVKLEKSIRRILPREGSSKDKQEGEREKS